MNRKNHFFVAAIVLLIVSNLACLFLFASKGRELEECWCKTDSLSRMEYLRYDEESDYYGMEEGEVMSFLQQPFFSNEFVAASDDAELFWPTSVYLYLKNNKMSAPKQIHQHVWSNPFSKRSIIDICFVMQDSMWIAVSCLEYDTNSVEF